MSDAPHLVIVMSKDATDPKILSALAKASGKGLSAVKTAISGARPVIDVEMYSNEYYDGEAHKLVELMDFLTAQHINYDVYELAEGETFDTADLSIRRISPEIFKNIVNEGDDIQDSFRGND